MAEQDLAVGERGRGDRAERAERVRRALAAAETATGLRPVERFAAEAHPEPRSTQPAGEPSDAAVLPEGWVEVPEALRPALPGIRRGSSASVTGSTSLLLHLVAHLSRQGAWCVVVARPDLGLAAAVDAGIDPEHLVLVPDPGPQAPDVLGALVDGFDLVVLGPCRALEARDRRSLGARIRHRGAILIASTPWEGADVRLQAQQQRWEGLEPGGGRLRAERMVVVGSGRGIDIPRTCEVVIGRDGAGTQVMAAPERPVPATALATVPAAAAAAAAPGDVAERRAG